MAQLTFDVDAVEFNAGGIESTLDLGTLPAVTLAAVMEYGARRYIQDYCNSQRFAATKAAEEEATKAKKPFDAKAFKEAFDMGPVLEARLGAMRDGKVERAAPRSAVPSLALGRMVDALAASDKSDNRLVAKGIKEAKGADRAKLVREAWDRLPEAAQAAFRKWADEEAARRAAAAKMDLGDLAL